MSNLFAGPAILIMLVPILFVVVVVLIVVRASGSGSRPTQPGGPGVSSGPVPALPTAIPAGWYPQGNVQRYWDGTQWTEHTAPLA